MCDKLQFGTCDPGKVPCDLDPYSNQHMAIRRHMTYHMTFALDEACDLSHDPACDLSHDMALNMLNM